MRNILSLLGVAAFCAVWLVTNHFSPWVSWHGEVMAFLAVFLLAWKEFVPLPQAHPASAFGLPTLALPFLALGLLATAQILMGAESFWGDVWVTWLYVALCVTCLALGYAEGTREKDRPESTTGGAAVTALAMVLVGGAVLSTSIALAQAFDVGELAGWVAGAGTGPHRRPGANLSQPNHLATFLVMGLASLLFLHQSRKLGSLGAATVFAFVLLGLAASESRTGALSFLLLTLWLLAKRRHLPVRIYSWSVALSVLGFAAMFWVWPSFWSAVQRMDAAVAVNVTSSGRIELWTQMLEVIARHPWLGWGVQQVAEGHNAVAHNYENVLPATYSHNLILDLAIWVGVPLAALLVLIGGRWLWHRGAATKDLLSWYCLAVALPLAVHSMLEYPFSYAYFLAPVMFALGVLESSQSIKPVIRLNFWAGGSLVLAISAVLVWSVVEYFEIEDDFRVARFEALRLGQTPAEHVRPKMILLTQLGALVEVVRVVPKPGMSSQEMELVKRVALHYPWSGTLSRYAFALSLNGNAEEGERQLQVMRRMFGEGTYLRTKARLKELQESIAPDHEKTKLP